MNKKAPGLNYSVPKDNPFVGEDNVRSEIWAYGFRNVWRLAFDHLTGRLWAGDVGQNRFEEIDIVTRGGNYGWNRMEGNHSFNFDSAWALPTMSESDLKAERDQFVKPALDYYHSEGRAIVGGRVYRGDRLPELDGAYLYADFFSGNVWALRHDGEQLQQDLKLCNSHLQVAGFGEDS
ncbi:MAG: PQQ-dependent sugar dehydrogenase, partial [Fuerstiella sp.]|nr:PQQ-dependent sugar dehydrogenase [Fuerstiella sp.]